MVFITRTTKKAQVFLKKAMENNLEVERNLFYSDLNSNSKNKNKNKNKIYIGHSRIFDNTKGFGGFFV